MNDDMLRTVKEINEKFKTKSCLYVLYARDAVVAASYKADMDKFLQGVENPISLYYDNLEEIILIHGLVLNPAELPFEISSDIMENRKLWLISECLDTTLMEPYKNMAELTEGVEYYLEDGDVIGIDDFAVILAEEIDLGLTVSKTGTNIQAVKVYG